MMSLSATLDRHETDFALAEEGAVRYRPSADGLDDGHRGPEPVDVLLLAVGRPAASSGRGDVLRCSQRAASETTCSVGGPMAGNLAHAFLQITLCRDSHPELVTADCDY
jgi:hypothetical protein